MRRNIFTTLVLLMYITISHAQSKKDLILEVDNLRTRVREAETGLSELKREERIASAKVESYEAQVDELKETNANLLKNLNSFTEASNKRSNHINSTLESLVKKEGQLRVINDELSSRDSIILAVFTQFKQTLGSDPKITVSNGAVAVVMENSYVFGDNVKNFKVQEKAEAIIAKIGAVLKANPTMDIQVVSNSNLVESKDNKSNNWEIGTQQAAAIARILESKYQIEPKRIIATGISELGLYTIETSTEIIVQPKFYEFYKLVKESMK
ncbi:hypothetical protein DHD32_20960 [Arenibacter sp. TNZ]|uniref:OmpA family protein n=1 Tax=Arenibacter TaxID=178469 RepID=UPI000CD3D3FE|nr:MULTISPECIES: OmpA family protein [Arenibacter]MCM4173944.1 hypothetical protein [Arenibacter sp. TNZ]